MNPPSKREIWLLSGPYWKIPLYFWNGRDQPSRVKIGAGLPLLECQRKAAEELLEPLGTRTGINFYIPMGMLKTVAKPTPLSAEECLVWNRPQDPEQGTGGIRFGFSEADDFCKSFYEYHQYLNLKSVSEVCLLFNAFCKHILHWLINKQKPVNLLFCRIHPMPYRQNWKRVLASLDSSAARKKRFNIKQAPWVIWKFLDPRLMECRYEDGKIHRTIVWSLDIEPTRLWFLNAFALERARKKAKRGGSYWLDVYETIRRRLPDAIALYTQASKAARKPYPTIPAEWVGKRPISITEQRRLWKQGHVVESHIVGSGHYRPVDPFNKGEYSRSVYYRPWPIQKEIVSVPEVSCIRPPEPEVRETPAKPVVDCEAAKQRMLCFYRIWKQRKRDTEPESKLRKLRSNPPATAAREFIGYAPATKPPDRPPDPNWDI